MNKHIGSSLDDFLKQEDLLEASTAEAVKHVIAWKLQQAIDNQQLTKTALANQMQTSRAAVNRILDPTYTGNSLEILERAAKAVNMRLTVDLAPY